MPVETPRWGYGKIEGELRKLGHNIGQTSVNAVLKRQKVPPSPERGKQRSSWRTFLRHYGDHMVACHFFTVETSSLTTPYALFFIELGTRRVHFAGCTAEPTAEWFTQQARQLPWTIQDDEFPLRFLIHARDTKFSVRFDSVFAAEGINIIRTPYRAPQANALAECWVRTMRQECLDHLLIVSEAHLRRVLSVYVEYFNHARPHQGIDQRVPEPDESSDPPIGIAGNVTAFPVLGGLHHEYRKVA